jgi:tRNA threonylcarbamoyladenosine biosynthesis protein TsaB
MRILALETSTREASVALLENGAVAATTVLNAGQRSAQSLAPSLEQQLRCTGWSPQDVSLVAVGRGPGSFTGLRVGVTTAKVFAYAVGAEVLGIDTLQVVAAQCDAAASTISAVIDAHRNQLFCARFAPAALPQVVSPTQIMGIDDWLRSLEIDQLVTGPGLARLTGRLPDTVKFEDPSQWIPRATTVGRLAWQHWEAGVRHDMWQLKPHYHRLSAAEEKHARRAMPPGPSDSRSGP